MPYFVIANSLGFECMMNIAEDEFLCSFEYYSDFDTKFEENKNKWEPIFISKAKEELIHDLKKIVNDNFIDEVSFHGDLYQKLDYMFHFVFKVSAEQKYLIKIIEALLEFKKNDQDEYNIVLNDMDNLFRPSYSGEEKKMVWNNLQVPGICWPPLIIED